MGGNKLGISIETEGASKSASDINKVASAVDALNAKVGKSGQTLKNFIGGFPAHMQQRIIDEMNAQGGGPAGSPIGGGGGGGGGTIRSTGWANQRTPGVRHAPPGAVPPLLNPGVNMKLAGLGILAGIVSPFAGARILSTALAGGGGGKNGGFSQALFGAGGLGGWGAIFTGLKYSAIALRFEFETLAKAVDRGAQLYTQSGVAGKTPGSLFALQSAGHALGLGPDQINKLAYQQSLYSKGRSFNAGGEFVRAARGLGDATAGTTIMQQQQLFTQTYERFKSFDMAVSQSSRSLFEFKSISGQLSDAFIGGLIIATGDVIKVFNLLAAATLPLVKGIPTAVKAGESFTGAVLGGTIGSLAPQILSLLPNIFEDKSNDRILAGQGGTRPESAWEKMGLVIQGGVGATDYAKQTADNTKRMADAMTGKGTVAGAAAGGIFNAIMSAQVFNLP